MSIALAATAAALAALAPIASLPYADTTNGSTPTTSQEEIVVEGPVINLGAFGSSRINEMYCPYGFDLTDHVYHPGTGWRIPPGVALRTGAWGIDASIKPAQMGLHYGAGGEMSSVTNWTFGDNWVQMILVCDRV